MWKYKLISQLTQPDFFHLAKKRGIPQFISISISHFAEFARWSLDISKLNYEEHQNSPFQHVFPAIYVRLKDKNYISSSSFTQNATNLKEISQKIAYFARLTTLPLVVLPNGNILRDSWDISSFAGLKAPPDDFKLVLDNEFGPLVRQLAYHHVLNPANSLYWSALNTQECGLIWKMIWNLGVSRTVTDALIKIFSPSDLEATNKCREKLKFLISPEGAIGKIVRLRNQQIQSQSSSAGEGSPKTTFLFSEHSPSQSDLALASLFAPLINPYNFAKGKFYNVFLELARHDSKFSEEMEYFRQTEVGKYALEMYQHFRL